MEKDDNLGDFEIIPDANPSAELATKYYNYAGLLKTDKSLEKLPNYEARDYSSQFRNPLSLEDNCKLSNEYSLIFNDRQNQEL